MNTKNVRKVIAALRSGGYTQGRFALKKRGEFCCLGVACDVSGLGEWKESSMGRESYKVGNTRANCDFLPKLVKEWLGFDRSMGPAILGFPHSAKANDSQIPFAVIADEWERLCDIQDGKISA